MITSEILTEYGLIIALLVGVVLESVKPLLKDKQKLPVIGLVVGGIAGALFSTRCGVEILDGVLVGVLASTFADSCYNIVRPALVNYVTERHLKKLTGITKEDEEAKTLEEERKNDKN